MFPEPINSGSSEASPRDTYTRLPAFVTATEFLQKMPVAAQWIGLDGVIQWANLAMLDRLGYAENEYVGHNIQEFIAAYDVFPDSSVDSQPGSFVDQLSTYGLHDCVVALSVKNGGIRHFVMNSKRSCTDGVHVHRVFAHDISHYKQAEQRSSMVLDASDAGIWDYEVERDRFIAHDQMLKMLGLQPGRFKGTLEAFLKCIHPQDREKATEAFNLAIEQGGEFNLELRFVMPDGTVKHVATACKLINSDGHAEKFFGVCTDITERKRAELKHRRISVMEQREEFMATLTHDLKNPLTSSNRVLELFATGSLGPLTEEQARVLHMLHQSNEELLDLIQNLIGVYKYDTVGPSAVTLEEVDVVRIIQENVQQLHVIAAAQKIQVNLNLLDKGYCILADRVAISRVVQNLLGNALKFTPHGGSIEVNMRCGGPWVTFEVSDTGPGIAPDDRAGLFERFWQGAAGKKYAPGTGLGLYVCRQIVQAHGGTIELIDREGPGATIRVSLPVARNAVDLRPQS